MSAGLGALAAKIERLASQAVKEHVAAKVRDVVHAECIRGFREQRNPYGAPWAPRKDPRGTWPILDKTGAGIDSLTASSYGGAVRLRIRGYFKFHQGGTKLMVAREVFPDPDRGLGTWTDPVHGAVLAGIREIVNG
jgi:hypothetical protein